MDEILKDLPRYITLQQAAEMSQFSTETLRKAISDGKLMASKPGGREIRILLSDFQFWMSDGVSEAMIDARMESIAKGRGPVLELRMNANLASAMVPPKTESLSLEKTLPWFKEVVKVLGGEHFAHLSKGLVTKMQFEPKARKHFGREPEELEFVPETVDLLLKRKDLARVLLHGNRKIASATLDYSTGDVTETAWTPMEGPISAGGMFLKEEHLIDPAAYAERLLDLLC